MSASGVTWRRTLGRAHSLFSTAVSIGGFLAAAGVKFVLDMSSTDGGAMPLAAVWITSVAPLLPVLAALLAMDVWSEELHSGRIELLLSAPVREGDYVLGKFLGVFSLTLGSTVLFLVTSLATLYSLAPQALSGAGAADFAPALFAVALQCALWCAVSVAASVAFRHASAAALASIAMTVIAPRGAWALVAEWSGEWRTAFGEMPFDEFAVDCAFGVVHVGHCVAYAVGVFVFLFAATVAVGNIRLVGRGGAGRRFAAWVSVSLALLFGILSSILAWRLDIPVDLTSDGSATALSARTRGILAESSGSVSVTCFLPRNDPRFRFAAHLLRSMKSASAAVGGARFNVRFVDPRWDIGAAERLVRRGVATDSVVFESGRRMVVLPFGDGIGERVCASTVRRLTMPPARRKIYWTVGHGETSFESYGAFGMSDAARDLMREGYSHAVIDLAAIRKVPDDCALVMVAGPADDFSRTELEVLDSYLRAGGRLMVMTGSARATGLAALLSSWGLRPQVVAAVSGKTLSGTDVVVSEFADHAISAPLKGLRIVLERPISFAQSAAVSAGLGADRIDYTAIAGSGQSAFAAAVERGAGAGKDIAVRPTRIVAVGDSGFVLNGQIAARANVNLDFFLNCVAYLAGTDPLPAVGAEVGVLMSGMDRADRIRHAVTTVVVIPAIVFAVLAAIAFRRRCRR